MLYNRRSVAMARLWVQHALLKGRPFRSLRDIGWHHIESIGTKVYSDAEIQGLFQAFSAVRTIPIFTHSDKHRLPKWIARWVPDDYGFFIAIQADVLGTIRGF